MAFKIFKLFVVLVVIILGGAFQGYVQDLLQIDLSAIPKDKYVIYHVVVMFTGGVIGMGVMWIITEKVAKEKK
ncbi:MAG: hypothetical protein ABH884_00105 [Candidatus Komeilibacteria bacterium]